MGKKSRKVSRAAIRADATPENRDSILPSMWGYGVAPNGGTIFPSAFPLTPMEAAGISAVRRCVSLIANAIAGREWQEWEGKRQLKPSRIVRRPAASMSRREWVWRVIASMALEDISHLLMVGGVDDEGVPGSLLPLPGVAIRPAGIVDPYGVLPPTQYQIVGREGIISGESVIPMRSSFWPGVPAHLVGVLKMARSTLMSSWAADSYASRYWQAGGQPVTHLTTEQALSDPQADAIGLRYQTRRSMGPDFPLVTGNGVAVKPFGADISQATGVEARREMVLDIARLFGVPAKYVEVALQGQSLTYANINDEALSLERFTLNAFVDPIQDVISDLLPGDPIEDRRMLINLKPLTQAGQESRYRAWAIATNNKPWMDPEEVRAEEGLAPGAPVPEQVPSLPGENSADAETSDDEVPVNANE